MDELNCNVALNSLENKITVNGIPEGELCIDINGDVDFTDLVQALTKVIDKEKNIILIIEDEASIIDPKSKLIIETLKKIFESYNESLQEMDEEDSSEVI